MTPLNAKALEAARLALIAECLVRGPIDERHAAAAIRTYLRESGIGAVVGAADAICRAFSQFELNDVAKRMAALVAAVAALEDRHD